MNPWAFLVIGIGIVLIIIGIKGTQHNITSAITGIPHPGTGVQTPSTGTKKGIRTVDPRVLPM
jgi:hypothetical protein